MYTAFKQQYTFGWTDNSVKGKTFGADSKLYFGTEVGAKDSAAACKPIDLKAKKQMAFEKALLQLEILEDFKTATEDVVINFGLMTCGYDENGAADTANAKEILTIRASVADLKASSIPFCEFTMPTNCEECVFATVSASLPAPEEAEGDTDPEPVTAEFTSGKFLLHFNPYI